LHSEEAVRHDPGKLASETGPGRTSSPSRCQRTQA
jgi:hypothetical protein